MGVNEQMLLIFITIVLIGQILLKVWSVFAINIHKINQKHFQEKNGLEDFYYSIYFLLYMNNLGIVYAYTAINYKVNYYIFLVILLVMLLSLFLYKKINPALTKIISNEKSFVQSRRFMGRDSQKILGFHFYINTFYQVSIIINSIIVIIVYSAVTV